MTNETRFKQKELSSASSQRSAVFFASFHSTIFRILRDPLT